MKDHTESDELINAFEGAVIEIELLASQLPVTIKSGSNIGANKTYHSVISAYFFYRSRALMNFHDDYQKGPVHAGKVTMYLRSYGWKKNQIESYKEMKREENMVLFREIDDSIKEAMDAMGGELMRYLEEAEKRVYKKKNRAEIEEKRESALDPFLSLFNLKGTFGSKKKKKPDAWKLGKEKKKATSHAQKSMWTTYKEFKKAYKLMTW